jgi:hypothetical protein
MHWASALLLAAAFACLGAIGQWLYGRAGMDLEVILLLRLQPQARMPSLGPSLIMALALTTFALPASAAIAHGLLRVLASSAQPFGSAYRVTTFAAVAGIRQAHGKRAIGGAR